MSGEKGKQKIQKPTIINNQVYDKIFSSAPRPPETNPNIPGEENKKNWEPSIWNGKPVSREFNLFQWSTLKKNISENPYIWGSGVAATVAMGLSVNYSLESGKFWAAIGATTVLVAMVGFLAKHLHDKAMEYKKESGEGEKCLEKELQKLWNQIQKYFPYKKGENLYDAFKPRRGNFSKSLSTTLVGGIGSLTAGAFALTANQYAPDMVVPYGWCMFTAVMAAAFLLLNRYARFCQEEHYHGQLDRQVKALKQLKANLKEHFGEKTSEKAEKTVQEVKQNSLEGSNTSSSLKQENNGKILVSSFNSLSDFRTYKDKIFAGVPLNAYEKSLITKDTLKAALGENQAENEKLSQWSSEGNRVKEDGTDEENEGNENNTLDYA